MQMIEIAEGQVVIGDKDSRVVAEITPAPDHFWVSLGSVHEEGLLINSHDWDGFVKLVNYVDGYVKENHNG